MMCVTLYDVRVVSGGVRRVYDVCATGVIREHVAGSRSRVGMSRSARQVITGAQGDMNMRYGGARLCGGGPRAVL